MSLLDDDLVRIPHESVKRQPSGRRTSLYLKPIPVEYVHFSLANEEYLTKRLRTGPAWDVDMQSDQPRSERSTLRGPRLAERNVVHSESRTPRNLMCSRDHILEAFLPLPHVDFECEGSFPKECHHCIAILIHLGCDIRDELGLIKGTVNENFD